MKEASGEANKTVIVIVLVGVIAAFGYFFLPKFISGVKYNSCCHSLGGRIRGCRNSEYAGLFCCHFPNETEDIRSNGVMSAFNSCYYGD